MYTFPQIILNKEGNSYIGSASKYITHTDLQIQLKELLNLETTNKYFVFEITGDKAQIKAVQTAINGAVYFFNQGNNKNRLIVHKDDYFFSIPKK